jgi:glycosyltransferase involved in cell wall biosynthesis
MKIKRGPVVKTKNVPQSSRSVFSKQPKISIIIPAFNSAKYISDALDSVFNQKYPSYEVIVVDDGSTDNTGVLLQSYEDRILYLYQPNAGPSAARNHGLRHARGEYICFLDGDDFFLPDKLSGQAAVLESDLSIGAVHSGWKLVDVDGLPTIDVSPWVSLPVLDLDTWLQWNPINLGAIVFRKAWIDKAGGFKEDLRQAEDFDIILRLALAGCKFSWQKKLTICYRKHSESLTMNIPEKIVYGNRVLNNFFLNADLPENTAAKEDTVRYNMLLWNAWHCFQTGYYEDLRDCLDLALKHFQQPCKMQTAWEWITNFAIWNRRTGQKKENLRPLWPYLKKVLSFDADEWESIERLLRWWTKKETGRVERFGRLGPLWNLFQRTAHFEKETGIRIETMLDWWVDGWAYYREGFYDRGLEGFLNLKGMTAKQLVCLLKIAISVGPDVTSSEQIDRLWDDLQRLEIISEESLHEVSGLYLSIFGRAAMHGEWKAALKGFHRFLRIGFHAQSILAFGTFVKAVLIYLLIGQKRFNKRIHNAFFSNNL